MNKFVCLLLSVMFLAGCGEKGPDDRKDAQKPKAEGPKEFVVLDKDEARTVRLEPAQAPPSSYEPKVEKNEKGIEKALDTHHQNFPSFRAYIQTDKPLYQPGETIWARTTEMSTKSLSYRTPRHMAQYVLLSPQGSPAVQKSVSASEGVSSCDIPLDEEIAGGEYILQAFYDGRKVAERKVIVSTYQPPRLKKKLEFLKKAYGPGDKAQASLQVHRATGETLAGHPFTAVVSLEGNEIQRFAGRTDAKGESMVHFTLPEKIEKEDGMLNILVEEAGVTESIARPIPIVLQKMNLSIYPEGGAMVAGLPSRVYFYATNTIGKPADFEGQLVDSKGEVLENFASYHQGMGCFSITPRLDEQYFIKVKKPVGVLTTFALPKPSSQGVVLAVAGQEGKSLQLAIHSGQEGKKTFVCAMVRENVLGVLSVTLQKGENRFSLPVQGNFQGVARVTIFDEDLLPMAERLTYLGRGQNMAIKITPRQEKYHPRGKVEMDVEARTPTGEPVQASLCLSVVDDTVLSFADDKTAHILAATYLQSEIPSPIEEPNFYFSKEEKAPLATDMLLATLGWRTFEWKEVFDPTPRETIEYSKDQLAINAIEEERIERKPAMRLPQMPQKKGEGKKIGLKVAQKAREKRADGKQKEIAAKEKKRDMAVAGKQLAKVKADEEMGAIAREDLLMIPEEMVYARKFPVPVYPANYDGPRNDFRETVFWEPNLTTDANGKASFAFYLSDAITTFRVTCEGVSEKGSLGRIESLVQSKLPFYMTAKVPSQVSAEDVIYLPLTLVNEQEAKLSVDLTARFSPLFKLLENVAPERIELQGGEKKSFFYPLEVVGKSGKGEVYFNARGLGLKDEFTTQVVVSPRGFPKQFSFSGTLQDHAEHTVLLPEQVVAGSLKVKLALYPSPLSTMIAGMDAMLQEPCGCFEQASSSNYPNVMVLQYLKEYNIADIGLLERINGLLDRGYKKIAGYECSEKGYEWFGGNPGHEALTAYGLMEFKDMQSVYEKLDWSMVKRTADWLLKRRDGKGGYLRNSRALDSFGGASPEITNAYITYALTEAGYTDLPVELKALLEQGEKTNDPYLLSLAVNAFFNVPGNESKARSMAERLAKMQQADGYFQGATHSITRSTGINLKVETTAIASLALLKTGEYADRLMKAMQWLGKNRNGSGGFWATQATVLSVKALTSYARAFKSAEAPGDVLVFVGEKQISQMHFEKGESRPLEFHDLASHLKTGANKIDLRLKSSIKLPYSLLVEYNAITPANDPECVVSLQTTLSAVKTKMGETVRLTAQVKNITDQGIPMTLVRIGLPGGLTFQTWQLKQLREKKVFSFYETNPREVICYFRDMAPKAEVQIPIDLVANVPGDYAGPASSTYLYYGNDKKNWAHPLKIRIGK